MTKREKLEARKSITEEKRRYGEVKKPKKPTHRLREKNEKPTRFAVLDIHGMEATYDLLNRLLIWDGRIKWVFATRKGPMLIAKTDTGATVVWPNMEEFNSFTKSQTIIADATGIYIPTPSHGEIRFLWEQAVDTFLRIMGSNSIQLDPPLREEIQSLLDLAWTATGNAQANNTGEFIDYMRCVKRVPRNPALEPGAPIFEQGKPTDKIQRIPPVVFIAEEKTWVHVPSFRLWLSIPALVNRQPPLADVRNGLILLDFEYHRSLHRGFDGDNETSCMWSGPLASLGD